MNKICTSVEQSEKLIELGIDVKTADMYYPNRTDIKYKGALPIEYKHGSPLLSQEIPAWSLSALLGLMPQYLFEWKRGIDLNIYPNLNGKGWHCSYMPNAVENMKNDKFKQITNGNNLIDAVFEMIVKLKNMNLL